MAIQFSDTVRNARLNAIETAISTAPKLYIRSGAAPGSTSGANTGTVLATLTLPSDWMGAASGGAMAKAGTWEDTSADNPGDAAHFRIFDSGDVECDIQGTVSTTSGSGDMQLDNTDFSAGQQFTITAFTLTDGNA